MRHELFTPAGTDAPAQQEYGRRRLRQNETVYFHAHAQGQSCTDKCKELEAEPTAPQ